ncbi:MAG: hypothetical protein HY059_10965 [Proteobacteria bacterium]|nr:hypothetical protein [Pseudomonadota bacterium]
MASSISIPPSFGGGPAGTVTLDPAYQAGCVAAAFNNQPWTAHSFFEPPHIQAPELVVFGTGKTYDFFA